MQNIKPYYIDQKEWSSDNFYGLHRCLHMVRGDHGLKEENVYYRMNVMF